MVETKRPGQAVPPAVQLQPPGHESVSQGVSSSRHWLIWGLLAVVILLGAGVLFVLPKVVATHPAGLSDDPVVVDITQETTPLAPLKETPSVAADRAARTLQDLLLLQARLELANAPSWGEPEWSQALEGTSRGNDYFAQRQFDAANDEFEQSLEFLTTLESEKTQRLSNALRSGWEALDTNDSDASLAFFETAIAIDSGNGEAQLGLDRSRIRPTVLQLMDTGDLAQSMQNLEQAREAYAEAAEADDDYEPAKTALAKVTAQITDIQFKEAMSQALTAIREEQVALAQAALQRADSLKPGEQVVADTRYRLDQLKRQLWLAEQRETGAEFELTEQWSDAETIYREVLKREPRAAFAREGLEKASNRARLHRQLDHYLQDPERVYSREPQANAEKLLAAASVPPADEPVLLGKIARLKTLITQARIPVAVTLESDGQTRVSVYHVGSLGVFFDHQLELTPGTYTVVGSRAGYRDVRKTLTVKPGSNPLSLDIRCEEPI